MATAVFYLYNGEPALFIDPGSVSKLRSKIESAMNGPSPTITVTADFGAPFTLEKSNIKSIDYR